MRRKPSPARAPSMSAHASAGTVPAFMDPLLCAQLDAPEGRPLSAVTSRRLVQRVSAAPGIEASRRPEKVIVNRLIWP